MFPARIRGEAFGRTETRATVAVAGFRRVSHGMPDAKAGDVWGPRIEAI
jgi:hypothetical protein